MLQHHDFWLKHSVIQKHLQEVWSHYSQAIAWTGWHPSTLKCTFPTADRGPIVLFRLILTDEARFLSHLSRSAKLVAHVMISSRKMEIIQQTMYEFDDQTHGVLCWRPWWKVILNWACDGCSRRYRSSIPCSTGGTFARKCIMFSKTGYASCRLLSCMVQIHGNLRLGWSKSVRGVPVESYLVAELEAGFPPPPFERT